jgi:hypothetical protein
VIAIPDDPIILENVTVPSASAKRIWERQLDKYVHRNNRLTSNCQSAYSLMIGQYTDIMVASLKGLKGYEKMNRSSDLIGLMKAINRLVYKFDGQLYHAMSLHLAKK